MRHDDKATRLNLYHKLQNIRPAKGIETLPEISLLYTLVYYRTYDPPRGLRLSLRTTTYNLPLNYRTY
ncbi:hypothetical protein, partial [Nautilia sp.]